MTYKLNAREELETAVKWLGYHHEDLNFGLKSAEDGLKLWRYWFAHSELPEFCDTDASETPEETRQRIRAVRAAIGYNPWVRAAQLLDSDAE